MVMFLFLLTSCEGYHLLVLNSEDAVRNNFNELVHVGDNYEVVHSFKGLNLPVDIRVYNDDQKQPIYVNWSRSFIVFKQDTLQLVDEIKGVKRETIEPQKYVDFRLDSIKNEQLYSLAHPYINVFDEEHPDIGRYYISEGFEALVTRFSKAYSPLRFRLYVNLSQNEIEKGFYVVTNFWLEELQLIQPDRTIDKINYYLKKRKTLKSSKL